MSVHLEHSGQAEEQKEMGTRRDDEGSCRARRPLSCLWLFL